jgi:hypothetical protein
MNNIQKTVFKVSDFISWQRTGSLHLSPAFQRRPVWPIGAKSFLIDTILRGIPMPIIFLRQRTNPKTLEPLREVVDGQQRLRTVIAFVEPTLLADFDSKRDAFMVDAIHNEEVAGKRFSQLSPAIRQRLLDYDFSVQVLPADTEDRDVLQIFARMNSTGYKLNAQELRNAEFFGVFKNLLYKLAYEQLDRWRSWNVFSETDIARMTEVEESSDIVITVLEGVHGKNQTKISEYYRRFNPAFSGSTEVTRRFRTVFNAIDDDIGKELSTLEFRRKPLFHTLFTFYYDLLFGLKSTMRRAQPKRLPKGTAQAVHTASERITSQAIPEELTKVLRGATNHLPARRTRLQFLDQALHGVKSH